jgi:Aldo/keto reductase family
LCFDGIPAGKKFAAMLQALGRQRSAVKVSLRFGKDFDAHTSTAATVQAVNRAAQALGRSFLDTILVPWPITSAGERSASVADTKARDAAKFAKTWTALLSLVQAGTVRHIGLDGCLPWHIDLLQYELKLQPEMNLLQVSPLQQKAQLVSFCHARGLEVLAVLSIDTADYATLSDMALPLVSASNLFIGSLSANDERKHSITSQHNIQSISIFRQLVPHAMLLLLLVFLCCRSLQWRSHRGPCSAAWWLSTLQRACSQQLAVVLTALAQTCGCLAA